MDPIQRSEGNNKSESSWWGQLWGRMVDVAKAIPRAMTESADISYGCHPVDARSLLERTVNGKLNLSECTFEDLEVLAKSALEDLEVLATSILGGLSSSNRPSEYTLKLKAYLLLKRADFPQLSEAESTSLNSLLMGVPVDKVINAAVAVLKYGTAEGKAEAEGLLLLLAQPKEAGNPTNRIDAAIEVLKYGTAEGKVEAKDLLLNVYKSSESLQVYIVGHVFFFMGFAPVEGRTAGKDLLLDMAKKTRTTLIVRQATLLLQFRKSAEMRAVAEDLLLGVAKSEAVSIDNRRNAAAVVLEHGTPEGKAEAEDLFLDIT